MSNDCEGEICLCNKLLSTNQAIRPCLIVCIPGPKGSSLGYIDSIFVKSDGQKAPTSKGCYYQICA